MAERGFTENKPTGITKWFFGAPRWLFKARLGFLFGKRMGMLEHIGRRSGRTYETPLEIVTHDGDRYVIAAGWGPHSDWFRNLQANPAAGLWVGTRRYEVIQKLLSTEDGAKEIGAYMAAHPRAAKTLWAGMGLEVDASDMEASQAIPTVALTLKR